MRITSPRHLIRLLCCLLPIGGCSESLAPPDEASTSERDPTVTTLSLYDLMGHTVDPFAGSKALAHVFIFVRTDCPISNRYAPTIRHLHEIFSPQGVEFRIVYANPDVTVEAIREHLSSYRLPMVALRDPDHHLVARTGVTITPEAVVCVPTENNTAPKRLYHGRIDNWYADFGKARPAPTQHDLRDALEAVLAGKPVAVAHAPAVGCYLEDLR